MDDELRALLKKIIEKLDSIENNTAETYWVKNAVEDLQAEIKKLRHEDQ